MQTIAKLTCELSYSANLLPHFLVHQVDKDGAGHEHKFSYIAKLTLKLLKCFWTTIFLAVVIQGVVGDPYNKIVDKIDVLVFGRKDCFGDNDKIQNSNCTFVTAGLGRVPTC